MNKFKPVFFIVALIIVGIAYTAFFGIKSSFINIKSAKEMRYGIDIRGGVEAVYAPKDLDRNPTSDELESARQIIETRLDTKNILDREVTVDQQNGTILVRFPWKSDEADFNPQTAIAELGETARLTFRDPDGNVIVEGKNVKKSTTVYDSTSQESVVHLEFDDEGKKAFSDATGRLINQRIGIYMDETLISNPTVKTQITEGQASITGLESTEAAKALADKISSGALPFSLESKNHSIISPSLGSGALKVMVNAGTMAFILVCIFMLLYYRLPGFVACIALILHVAGQLLALSVPQFTLTLPGITAVILSIGMGVDANIITAERIKEELKNGKTLKGAIDSGYHKAFTAVFDGNITVLIVAVMLMIFGSGTMLSFGYSLITGVILNFVASVLASRLMTKSLSQFDIFKNPILYGARRAK
ncbi:MAG: protein translocase subunit SecD [Clostridia bacterium]|nr:protein translocase subunit SecD [Clostridia bacterium]